MIEVCETATFELLSEQLGEAAAQALVNEGRSVALQRASRDALDVTTTPTGVSRIG